MRSGPSCDRRVRFPWVWAGGLLMLLSLAACGAIGQPAATTPASAGTSAAVPVTSASAPGLSETDEGSSAAAQATQPPPTESPPTLPTRKPTLPAPTGTPALSASQGWQTYRNEPAGYSVEYPPGWRAAEVGGAPGEFVTSFGPQNGGAGIFVAVRQLDLTERDPIDLPSGRCQPVEVGGRSGIRCFDTISLDASTAVAGQGRQVIITTTGQRLDQALYQRFLDSFVFF